MANGSEKGEIVVSSIRAGMKREFLMMMKAQADWDIGVGKKRVTRSPMNQNSADNVSGGKVSAKKRKREVKIGGDGEDLPNSKVVVGEELGSDVVVKKDDNVVLLGEDLSSSKVVGEELGSDGVAKKDDNVVLLGEDLLSSKVVGEELGSDEVAKKDDNVVLLGEDLSSSKVVGEELDRDGAVKRDENVVLLSEEEELKSDVVDCTSEDEKKGKMDEEVARSGEEGNAAKMQICGDDAKTEMGKIAEAGDGLNEEVPEIVPELAVNTQDEEVARSGEEGNAAKMQICGDDAKTEMGKPAEAGDGLNEEVPEIVPELAVNAQDEEVARSGEEGNAAKMQICGGDAKTEMGKPAEAGDGLNEEVPAIVPELAVSPQDEEVARSGEEGNAAKMQICGDDAKTEMGKPAEAGDGLNEEVPEIVPELAVNAQDEEVARSGEEGNAAKMQICGGDAKTEMGKPAEAGDGLNEEVPEIVPELAVNAQDEEVARSGEEGNAAKMQICGGDAKTEMGKPAEAGDGLNEEVPEFVPELAVNAQEDEQKHGDDTNSEIPKTGKASDCIVGAMPELVPDLAVTDQADDENEQNCRDDTKTEMAKTAKANVCIAEAMPDIVPELAVTAQGDGKGEQKVLLQSPPRRFTRSALRIEDARVSQCDNVKIVEGHETDSAGTASAPAKLELKMSKKVAPTKVPTKLKDLLETGLLEGLPVRYIRGTTKGRGRPAKGLRGEIRGLGIKCFCDNCHGTTVITPNQFELHANSANKRPPEYIYLDNGKSLRDVLSMCKDASSDELEMVIKNAIGSADANLFASARVTAEECKSPPVQSSEASSRSTSSVPATKLTDQVSSGSGTQSKVHGKLTRKDLRMHRLVFEEDALPDGTALAYYVRGQKLLEGYKKGHGIFCYCCNTEVSPSQFEAHAGCASRRKPYLYIYTSNGVSLHELSIKLSKERRSSAEENDDLCSICADGGDLLCCDNCPRAFHAECVFLPSIPSGTWYCKYCENMFAKERFVETNANAIAAGRVAGIDAIEQITRRCIRIVETLETDVTVCVLCRDQDFTKSGFGPRTVIICDQCEKEYHVGCLKEHIIDDLQELPKDKWFCCTDCSRIHSALEKLVSDGEQNIPESLLKVLKEKNEGKDSGNNSSLDIKWRLLSGKMSSEETRVWLSSAVSIFHERFDPIADASTSRLDLIPHMVYGRNFKDQDYGGMFCAILLVNSLVVSAGIIRIFGKEVAELPLVATSTNCQGQGYFQSLFSCMENLLQSLNIEKLVLPSAEETESIWTNKFSFTKISEEQLKHYRKNYQMMVFSGTSMLQKQVGGSK